MNAPAKLLSEEAVRMALRQRFSAPEWALLPQVRNGTGWQRRTRTADALAMCLYPSRGLELHGFEIKVSRSDWKRELKDPEKAEEIQRFCDRWWIVVGDAAIVQDGELPPTWGLLVPRGDGLMAKVDAPKLAAEPISRLFLAAVLRKAQEVSASDGEIKAAVAKALDDAHQKRAESESHALKSLTTEYEGLQARVLEFEAAAGVRISNRHGWPGPSAMGAAVKFALDGGMEAARRDLTALRSQAARALAGIDAALSAAGEEAKP